MQADRDEAGRFTDAAFDAEMLYKAGPGKMGTDEKTYVLVLTTRTVPHLRNVFNVYLQKYGKDIKSHIKSEFTGYAEDALCLLGTIISLFCKI